MDLLRRLMAKGKKIYHRNDMRQALSALSLPPRRILWLVLAQLEKDSDGLISFDPNRVYKISAKEYAKLCDIDDSVAYKQLKNGVKEIRSHLMEIDESNLLSKEEFEHKKRPSDGVVLFTVANYSYYTDGEGYIEVKLDPVMEPFISKLRSNFTGQFLLSALRLPDSNANKLYLLLREWISSGCMIYKDIGFEELKNKLGMITTKEYVVFDVFRRSFFNRASKKIVDSTEFTKIDMHIIERRSRKAHALRISYEFDGQRKDMTNAGFLLGKKEKPKSETTKENGKNKEIKNNSFDDEDLKQINGRYYTREEAKVSGYDWDEY